MVTNIDYRGEVGPSFWTVEDGEGRWTARRLL